MPERLRIAVTGLAATYPFGGVFWDYMQYPLGFMRLGHEVLYIEDTGKWCYDPARGTFVRDGARNAALLAQNLELLDPALSTRWFFRDGNGTTYGRPADEAEAFCRSADLFLHLSASSILRDAYQSAAVVAFIDSDPMYTQVGFLAAEEPELRRDRIDWWKRHHDVFFSFGENVGQPECTVPDATIIWNSTRQPIVRDCFETASVAPGRRRRVATTVASWEPSKQGLRHEGIEFAGKSSEFHRFIELPRYSPVPLEVAMSGPAPRAQLEQAGWRIVDGYGRSRNPWVYREYLAHSFAEFSVAKHAYVASHSGWFSCRSACYLALGVPVIVQDTGFSSHLPTGQGLLTFSSADEAAGALEAVAADYERHAYAASDLAAEFFDSAKVLGRLIEVALGGAGDADGVGRQVQSSFRAR